MTRSTSTRRWNSNGFLRTIVLGLLFTCGTCVVAQEATAHDSALVRLQRWLEVVEQHTPGTVDAAALEIAGWSRQHLTSVAGDVARLSLFVQRSRQHSPAAVPTIELHNTRFTLAEILESFHGNATLRRGAMLHADLGSLVQNDRWRPAADDDDSDVLVVSDGRSSGKRYESVHWEIGRLILDAIKPEAAEDPGVTLWYRAASAYLLREGHLGQARAHLERAQRLLPDDPMLLLDRAYFHQILSSISIQAAADDLRLDGADPAVGTRRAELIRAERLFRQALSRQPDHADARMRLGHTLGLLDRHEDAVIELRAAIASGPAGAELYFAELFLGHQQQALGRHDEARRHYENAAELYPFAQSPQLALSHLARASGDRAGALRALTIVFSLRPSESERWDPWWDYYDVHREDADRLMEQMRALARMAAR
jgi:hypothetical protein